MPGVVLDLTGDLGVHHSACACSAAAFTAYFEEGYVSKRARASSVHVTSLECRSGRSDRGPGPGPVRDRVRK